MHGDVRSVVPLTSTRKKNESSMDQQHVVTLDTYLKPNHKRVTQMRAWFLRPALNSNPLCAHRIKT